MGEAAAIIAVHLPRGCTFSCDNSHTGTNVGSADRTDFLTLKQETGRYELSCVMHSVRKVEAPSPAKAERW